MGKNIKSTLLNRILNEPMIIVFGKLPVLVTSSGQVHTVHSLHTDREIEFEKARQKALWIWLEETQPVNDYLYHIQELQMERRLR